MWIAVVLLFIYLFIYSTAKTHRIIKKPKWRSPELAGGPESARSLSPQGADPPTQMTCTNKRTYMSTQWRKNYESLSMK